MVLYNSTRESLTNFSSHRRSASRCSLYLDRCSPQRKAEVIHSATYCCIVATPVSITQLNTIRKSAHSTAPARGHQRVWRRAPRNACIPGDRSARPRKIASAVGFWKVWLFGTSCTQGSHRMHQTSLALGSCEIFILKALAEPMHLWHGFDNKCVPVTNLIVTGFLLSRKCDYIPILNKCVRVD